MGLNTFEALCAKAGKLKKAIVVFSLQDTLQQHDTVTTFHVLLKEARSIPGAREKTMQKLYCWSHCYKLTPELV